MTTRQTLKTLIKLAIVKTENSLGQTNCIELSEYFNHEGESGGFHFKLRIGNTWVGPSSGHTAKETVQTFIRHLEDGLYMRLHPSLVEAYAERLAVLRLAAEKAVDNIARSLDGINLDDTLDNS
jgi:hypothetical protein